LVPSIDTVGPLAGSMSDIEAAYRAMSGDQRPLPGPGTLRFGVPQPWYELAPIDDEIATAFSDALASLGEMGHDVHPIDMPDAVPSRRLIDAIGEEVSSAHRGFRARGESYDPMVESRIEVAESVTPEATRRAREWQQMIRDRFADAFATVDFLVTPAVPVRRKVIGEDMIGQKSHRTVISYFSALVNHALHPAVVLPIADSGAPPASLQLIGPLHGEPELMGIGRTLEEVGLAAFRTSDPNTRIRDTR
jgi:Asp-tRNA(Asn)/Glu-tRNA(Gln) amidotransferase A subunit family amidase